MKHLTYILALFLLMGCKLERKDKEFIDSDIENVQEQSEPLEVKTVLNDSIHNYWEISLDTIKTQRSFKHKKHIYSVDLKTYSLNDSSLVRILTGNSEKVYLDYAHNKVTAMQIFGDSIIFRKTIGKNVFENVLNKEFFKECNLHSTEIDSIVEGMIYMTTDLAIPDTDNQWRVWYRIDIQRNKIDRLKIIKADYVGL